MFNVCIVLCVTPDCKNYQVYNYFLMRHMHNVQRVMYGHYRKYFKLSPIYKEFLPSSPKKKKRVFALFENYTMTIRRSRFPLPSNPTSLSQDVDHKTVVRGGAASAPPQLRRRGYPLLYWRPSSFSSGCSTDQLSCRGQIQFGSFIDFGGCVFSDLFFRSAGVGGGAAVASGFLTGLAPHFTVVRFGLWWLRWRFFVGIDGGFHGGPSGGFVLGGSVSVLRRLLFRSAVVRLPSLSSVFIFVALLDSSGHLLSGSISARPFLYRSLHPLAPIWVVLVGCSSFLAWLLFYSDDGAFSLSPAVAFQ